MKSFEATADIQAPAATVWQVLADTTAWPSWDSGIQQVTGRLALGEKISIAIEANPGRTFAVTVTELAPEQGMIFSGGIPGLFRGVRTYTLAQQDGTTRFTMRENYSGLLAGLIGRSIPDLGPSFRQFANGLKRQAEQRT